MSKQVVGHLTGANLKISVVVSRFNEFITGKLLSGVEDALKRHGVNDDLGTRGF